MKTHKPKSIDLSGRRILITSGVYMGQEGICLGKSDGSKWSVSPEGSNEILSLQFEKDFSLLIDLSQASHNN